MAVLPALLSEDPAPTQKGARVAPVATAEPPLLAVLLGPAQPQDAPNPWALGCS